jgi:hypothetical protein
VLPLLALPNTRKRALNLLPHTPELTPLLYLLSPPQPLPFFYFEASVALANANAGLLCSAVGVALHASPGPATLLAVVLLLIGTLLAGAPSGD